MNNECVRGVIGVAYVRCVRMMDESVEGIMDVNGCNLKEGYVISV